MTHRGVEFGRTPVVEGKTGRSGQFDIVLYGRVAYSRYETGRFPSEEEIARLLAA